MNISKSETPVDLNQGQFEPLQGNKGLFVRYNPTRGSDHAAAQEFYAELMRAENEGNIRISTLVTPVDSQIDLAFEVSMKLPEPTEEEWEQIVDERLDNPDQVAPLEKKMMKKYRLAGEMPHSANLRSVLKGSSEDEPKIEPMISVSNGVLFARIEYTGFNKKFESDDDKLEKTKDFAQREMEKLVRVFGDVSRQSDRKVAQQLEEIIEEIKDTFQ